MEYRFSHRTYRLPLRTPLRTAHGLWAEREGIILRLEDENGTVGFGEIAPIPWFGTETMAEADEMCRKFSDRVTEAELGAVPDRMGCVRFALAAARGAIGRDLPDPSQKLNDDRTKAGFKDPAQQSMVRVPLTTLLPAGRGAIEVLLTRLEAGWLSFKWKVGIGDTDEELGLLDELMERLPAYAKLRLDANGAWTRRQAARWLERCAERPLEFVEQPVAPADVDSLMGLSQDYPVTLALDESVVRIEEARQWQARGWPGVFVIKPTLAGSLDEVADWFVQTKPDVVLSSAIETVLGRAAIWRFVLGRHPELMKRSPGYGIGEMFTDRRWDGPFTGPVLDTDWSKGVNPEDLWNALG